jgi:hypothetical protein
VDSEGPSEVCDRRWTSIGNDGRELGYSDGGQDSVDIVEVKSGVPDVVEVECRTNDKRRAAY